MSERVWDLRRRRLAARISLVAVASRFGCTRERIRQIEASPNIRPETRTKYEQALAAAIKQRDAVAQLLRVLTE